MNERGLVEVPENAVRDEPIAFGLTGIQLGICGVAVLVAAALNLLPLWEPIRIVPHRARRRADRPRRRAAGPGRARLPLAAARGSLSPQPEDLAGGAHRARSGDGEHR